MYFLMYFQIIYLNLHLSIYYFRMKAVLMDFGRQNEEISALALSLLPYSSSSFKML